MASFARRRLLNVTGTIATVSFLGALRPVRAAKAAEGSPVWNVKGIFLEACPCEAICPCEVDGPPTAGSCTVLDGFHIDSGRHGDLALDGLNAVRMIHSPGHMAKGNFRVAFYLDERANPKQREALSAIFSVKPGGAFVKMAGAVADDLGNKFVPITFQASGKQRKLSVGGIADADVTAIAGTGDKEILVENTRQIPLVAARSTHAAYKDHDIQMEVSSKNGFYSPFAFSSA